MEYNVGDKVILEGKETEITEVAYDGNGGKMYGVKDSLNYHYDNEFKEEIWKTKMDMFVLNLYGGLLFA